MPSATARARSPTPDGICPFFDFKELDRSAAAPLEAPGGAAPGGAAGGALAAAAAEEDPASKLELGTSAVDDASATATADDVPALDREEEPYDPWNPWDCAEAAGAGAAVAGGESGAAERDEALEEPYDPWNPWHCAEAAGAGAAVAGGESRAAERDEALEVPAIAVAEAQAALPWEAWERSAEPAASSEEPQAGGPAACEPESASAPAPRAEAAAAAGGRQEQWPAAAAPVEEQWPAAAAPVEEQWPAAAAPVEEPAQQAEWGQQGWPEERYVVTIATYVSIYPWPDDKSTPVLGRFSRNEIVHVFEWDETGTWRRCRTKREDGPAFGWVKVITWKYGPLMVPAKESEKLDKLCKGDASGVLRAVLEDLCEENVQKHVPGMMNDKRSSRLEQLRTARRVRTPGADAPLRVDDGRLVLGLWPRPASKTSFSRVLVMGAHHTCSTALTRELEAQFFVKVENNYDTVIPEARPENHKHRVMPHPPSPQDALIVCLVKEPCFWLQSLTRAAATYAIHALEQLPDGSYVDLERHLGAMEQRSQEELLDAILGPVEFFGDVYPDGGALRVWEASVRSYFDEAVYPLWRTAVVRCEDFLFSFDAVMEALGELGLRRRPKAPPPDGRGAKSGVVHFKARNREEALCWYGEEAHRHVGLQPRHVQAVSRCLGDLILGPLGYGDDAVRSWSSRPARIFIAGSWGQYQPVPMAWNGKGFAHSLRMGRRGRETFQLLLEGSWESVLYPSIPDAGKREEHEIWGPDALGHGLNWTLGREDGAKPGDLCNIDVEVDSSGMPVRVTWDVVPAKQ